MGNIEPCMDVLAEGAQPPPGFQFIHTHIVFDIKMDFTRKVRFVANGSTTEVEAERTYASVVSRDSVRIALLYAALNNLDILSGDVAHCGLLKCSGRREGILPVRARVWTVGRKVGNTHKGTIRAQDKC